MKLKATGTAGGKSLLRGIALSLGTLLPLPYWPWEVVNWGSLAVTVGGLAALTVWTSFNVPELVRRVSREPRCEPTTARRPRLSRDSFRMPVGMDEDGRTVYSSLHGTAAPAVRRAAQNGTLSLNGYRYLGPPPGPYGFEGPYEVREGVRVPAGPAGLRITKSACDSCGTPTGTAWCEPGTVYLCRRCSQR